MKLWKVELQIRGKYGTKKNRDHCPPFSKQPNTKPFIQ